MGNTMVFKAAEVRRALFQAVMEAIPLAFPKGCNNTGLRRGSVVRPPAARIRQVVNVSEADGSSRVADHLKQMHPKVNRLRAILGLDAKNAEYVATGDDIEARSEGMPARLVVLQRTALHRR